MRPSERNLKVCPGVAFMSRLVYIPAGLGEGRVINPVPVAGVGISRMA